MAKTMERLMVSIPTDVKSEIDAVKQQDFYDKPYAELYRHTRKAVPIYSGNTFPKREKSIWLFR